MTRKTDPASKTNRAGRRTSGDKKQSGPIDVTVVLLDGGYASEAIGPIEVFHSAGYLWNLLHGEPLQPRFRVRTASLDGGSVTSLYSVGLQAEFAISDIEHTDIIVVPATSWELLDKIAQDTPLLPWLRKWHAKGAYIAGICMGVTFLAECGLLDGRQATTHWAVAELLRQRYPQVLWRPEQMVTEDGPMFCSGGVYAAIDLSLYLVEKFCGHEVALQCAKTLLLSMPRTRQSGYSMLPLTRPHADDKIRQAEEYLQAHYHRTVSIDALAEKAGMSGRNFVRRFQAAVGRTPGDYIQLLRIATAKEMLERSELPIQSICLKAGYEDIAFFRRLFKRHTGMTPVEYRKRFAGMSVDRGELASHVPP
jgi:transcriptional regulator GlxA family with amidase domain